MKIAILGNAGSGKSTLGLKLHKFLNLPLIHLDQHFWKPGWVEPERAEFEKIHNQLCEKSQWIIEGMSVRNAEYRIQNADIVIYLDVPRRICFRRIFKRAIEKFGTVNFSGAKGCPERGPSIKFLKYVWNFDAQKKPEVLSLFEKYKDEKGIFIMQNENEIEKMVESLEDLYFGEQADRALKEGEFIDFDEANQKILKNP